MSEDNKSNVKLSLTVTLNKEGNKVLYAIADSHFVDIVLSFLTLPLGRVVKILEKHYGDEAPVIGSLNTLYHGIAKLDASHFWTQGAKETLLDSRSSFEAEYKKLKIDISDSPPPEYFFCSNCTSNRFRSVSVYYDRIYCRYCSGTMSKEVSTKSSEVAASSSVEVFTKHTTSFIISDDLHILLSETGFLQIIGILGITDTDNGKSFKADLGFDEIMKLLKASLTSPTPLSDVILKKTAEMNSPILKYQPKESYSPFYDYRFVLTVMIHKSTGKLLYAQAPKGFVEFLLSLLYIPLGQVESLIGGKTTCFKAIDNLYHSTSVLIGDASFSSQSTKSGLMKPNLVHGCISQDPGILSLTQEPLHANDYSGASSIKFPNGQGNYLRASRTYKVMDDLTFVPYCFFSILSSLREQKILVSDIKEVEVKIGYTVVICIAFEVFCHLYGVEMILLMLVQALSIMKASLTSTCALSHAFFNHISTKQPKTEV